MFKKYLLIFITSTALIGATTGCSLFKSDTEESADGTVAEETTGDETTETTEETVAEGGDEEVVDEYPDDDYGTDSAVADNTELSTDSTTTTTTTTDTTTDVADTSTATDTTIPDAPLETNTEETLFVAGDTGTDTATDTTTTTTVTETNTVRDSYDSSAAVVSSVRVKKMREAPFTQGGTLLNRLYIVRQGDTMKSISTKIYGDESRAKDLKSWNTTLKNTPKVGEKVYYASARNPADSTQMLTYYEDVGVQPSYYTAKKGESIRKVSKQLLGHERSWMEVYATNEGDNYWTLSEGASIRYWPSDAGATAAPVTQAATEEVPPAATEEAPPAQETAAADLPPADEGMPVDEVPPAPVDESAAMANTEEPPPPPADDMGAPPPPPPAAAITPPEPPAASASGLAGLMDGQEDSMMVLVLGGLLVLASIILLIFIRRGRKKVKYG